MPIVLYQVPPSGPCRAVIMTAENLGIELDKKYVDLMAGDQLKPEFLKINPQHCVPTIDDGGFYLWESRTIMTYLVNKYAPDSPLYPKDPKERAIVDRMLYFDIGTLYKTQMEYLAGGYDLSAYPKITAWLQKLKVEIPNYEEINVAPLKQLKEFLDSGKYKEILEARKKKTPT